MVRRLIPADYTARDHRFVGMCGFVAEEEREQGTKLGRSVAHGSRCEQQQVCSVGQCGHASVTLRGGVRDAVRLVDDDQRCAMFRCLPAQLLERYEIHWHASSGCRVVPHCGE